MIGRGTTSGGARVSVTVKDPSVPLSLLVIPVSKLHTSHFALILFLSS